MKLRKVEMEEAEREFPKLDWLHYTLGDGFNHSTHKKALEAMKNVEDVKAYERYGVFVVKFNGTEWMEGRS